MAVSYSCSVCGLAVIVLPAPRQGDAPEIIRACPHDTAVVHANLTAHATGRGGMAVDEKE